MNKSLVIRPILLVACLIVMNIGVSLAQDRRSVPRFEATAEFRPPIQTSCSTLTSQREGDFCWDSDNDNLYIYTGSTWSLVGTTTSVSTLSGTTGLTVDPDSDSNVGAGDFGGIVTVGSGDNADISFRFDQGSGQDPAIAWDDSAATFEFDFDGTLADGLDPFFGTATLGVPTTIVFEGTSADAFEGTLTLNNPGSDYTWTLPTLDTGGTATLLSTGIASQSIGSGLDENIGLVFNQATGTDPQIIWVDADTQVEFDFDGTLSNNNDVQISSTAVTSPDLIARSGSNAGTITFSSGVTVAQFSYDSTNDTITLGSAGFELDDCSAVTPATSVSASGCGVMPLAAGSTQINTITTCAAGDTGRILIVICSAGTPAFGDGAGNIQLSAAFTCTSNDTLSLVCDGTNWLEVARAVN